MVTHGSNNYLKSNGENERDKQDNQQPKYN